MNEQRCFDGNGDDPSSDKDEPSARGGSALSLFQALAGENEPSGHVEPVTALPAPCKERILVPNQVDAYQNLVVDENGMAVYGVSVNGYPLDPFGQAFLVAQFEEITAAKTDLVPPLPGKKVVEVLAATQVDAFGVEIVDENGSSVFGMDETGWYTMDSAGQPFPGTRWVEIEVATPPETSAFNAILIVDISRSMMARDLHVENIGPKLRAIKASIGSTGVAGFLDQFKDGTYVPRRLGAAFGTIVFFTEKVDRGLGEKIAVVRFADVAESLDFDESAFMGGSEASREFLARVATTIIDKIGNSYGQATSMGKALYLARELVDLMQRMEGGRDHALPTSIILLTDGHPTDGDSFNQVVEDLAGDTRVIFHVCGLGSPNVELMTKATRACRGDFFTASSVDHLINWYASRAHSG